MCCVRCVSQWIWHVAKKKYSSALISILLKCYIRFETSRKKSSLGCSLLCPNLFEGFRNGFQNLFPEFEHLCTMFLNKPVRNSKKYWKFLLFEAGSRWSNVRSFSTWDWEKKKITTCTNSFKITGQTTCFIFVEKILRYCDLTKYFCCLGSDFRFLSNNFRTWCFSWT